MAERSSILRDSVSELTKLKEEATALATVQAVREAAKKIEESAQKFFEEKLQDLEGDNEPTLAADTNQDVVAKGEDMITVDVYVPPTDNETHTEKSNDGSGENEIESQDAPESTYIDSSDAFDFETGTVENDNKEEIDLTLETIEKILKEYSEMADNDDIMVKDDETAPEAVVDETLPVETPEEGNESTDNVGMDATEEIETILLGDDTTIEEEEEFELTEEELAQIEKDLNEEFAKHEEEVEDTDADAGIELTEEEIAEIENLLSDDSNDEFLTDEQGEGVEQGEEAELEEAQALTISNKKHTNAKPDARLNENVEFIKLTNLVTEMIAENKVLKSQNATLKGTLSQFNDKLFEATITISKTACANKLFMENVTTQDEKKSIITSLASANSRDEVKNLYEQFTMSLSKGSNKSEIFESKVNNSAIRGDKSMIIENTAFDATRKRFTELINYKPQ
jgi:hypothetical protein